MKTIIFIFIFSCTILISGEIRIAVASSVSYAITPLIKAFNAEHPQTKVSVILGNSEKLTAQITRGAPYDVFISENMRFPNSLKDANLTASIPVIYAQGTLAILSQKERNYCAEIFVLKSPDIKKISITNPKMAPYGAASIEALKNAKLYKKLKKKFMYGESISQTVIYAISIADIGLIAKSELYSPKMKHYKEAIHWSEINESLYTPIAHGIVHLKRSKDNAEAKAFYDFMLGVKAKDILKQFGYKTL